MRAEGIQSGTTRWKGCNERLSEIETAALRLAGGGATRAPLRFPPKLKQAAARRHAIGRRAARRARKAAGFPANNAKWCICQGEFVHRAAAPAPPHRHSISTKQRYVSVLSSPLTSSHIRRSTVPRSKYNLANLGLN